MDTTGALTQADSSTIWNRTHASVRALVESKQQYGAALRQNYSKRVVLPQEQADRTQRGLACLPNVGTAEEEEFGLNPRASRVEQIDSLLRTILARSNTISKRAQLLFKPGDAVAAESDSGAPASKSAQHTTREAHAAACASNQTDSGTSGGATSYASQGPLARSNDPRQNHSAASPPRARGGGKQAGVQGRGHVRACASSPTLAAFNSRLAIGASGAEARAAALGLRAGPSASCSGSGQAAHRMRSSTTNSTRSTCSSNGNAGSATNSPAHKQGRAAQHRQSSEKGGAGHRSLISAAGARMGGADGRRSAGASVAAGLPVLTASQPGSCSTLGPISPIPTTSSSQLAALPPVGSGPPSPLPLHSPVRSSTGGSAAM